MLPDTINRRSSSSSSASASSSHTSVLNGDEDRSVKIQTPKKFPTSDFNSHFVIKGGSSSSSAEKINENCDKKNVVEKTSIIPIPDIIESESLDVPIPSQTLPIKNDSNLHVQVPPTQSTKDDSPRPVTAPPVSSPKSIPSFQNSSPSNQHAGQVSLSSLSINSLFPPRRSYSLQHPFMKSPQGPSSGRMFESSPRTSIISFPDSPMDFSYQPVSPYCYRKNKMGDFEFEGQETYDRITLSVSTGDYEAILKACGQRGPIPIDMIFNGVKDIEKIGEGVYGEVYSGSFRYFSQCSWVYKVVAIAGDMMVNGEKQKGFSEVLPEIVVSQELSKLKGVLNKCYTDGYAYMKNARIAKGPYPTNLLQPWDNFHEKYESDNDKPNFGPDQLYMVLEFEFAGQDIESLNFRDARQTLSIVLQVAHILAVGEFALEFEHRDLHWGNILVQNWQAPTVRYLVNGETLHVPSVGIKAAVIDFTISRVKHSKTQLPVYLDLQDDEEQFLGTGDHQFDIYRMMRDHNRNNWDIFSPKTNVFWLHYLANKLYVKGQYTSASTSSSSTTSNMSFNRKSAHHLRAVRKLREFSYSILNHNSAKEFVMSRECKEYLEFLGLPTQTTPTLQTTPISISVEPHLQTST